MANPLTGDFEGALQIAVRQINGLLGTIHQNAAFQDAALKLIHSATLRIGAPRRRRPEEVGVFGDWLIQHRKVGPGRGLRDVRAQLTATAPPGAAQMLSDALAGFDKDGVIELPPDVVRGLAKIQVSSLTITVLDGSSSEVTVHACVRAHYYPDANTTEIPGPVHGDLRAAFDIRRTGTRLVIQPSPQDSKIQFVGVPGAGLDTAEASRIGAEIRKALREKIIMPPVDLPPDFPFADFKGLGSGASQVIALPFQLSNAGTPDSGLQGPTQSFVGSSGFALAVSKEHVISLIDIQAIQEGLKIGQIEFGPITYRLRFSDGPTLTFKSGGFEISGRVEAETSTSWAPNGFVSFRQLIALVLDAPNQTFQLQPAGEPNVDESWFIPHGIAVNVVRSQIRNTLSSIDVSPALDDGKNKLVDGLAKFDPAAEVSFTDVEVTPDGVIVRGEIGSGAARRPPVVEIAETHQGAAFTAFQSWIPAGRIDRFKWSWVEYSGQNFSVLSGTQRSLTDEHSFIMPKPAGVTEIDRICLRIEGTQITPGGHVASIAAGTTCLVPEPEFAIDVPPWWGPLTLPIWQPNLDDKVSLRVAIAGHVSVHPEVPGQFSRNTLVFFADWSAERPLDTLSLALNRVQKSAALTIIAVLPAGAFDASRREIESRLPIIERIGAPLQFTEDDEGNWSRMFAVARTPSVYLVNAKREFVWKYEGAPDPVTLAAGLDKHLAPTRAPRSRPLRLTVSPGDSARDVLFEDDRGHQFALHRFRGRDVLLNFWQSWSAPCLTELGRLQRLHQAASERPFIVAFHGGKNSKSLDVVRNSLGVTFPLVQDAQQRVARQFGVRCWPTTVLIDAEGRVQNIQFGTEHGHGLGASREQAKQAEATS